MSERLEAYKKLTPKDRRKIAGIKKHEGDDLYSWALFINGRVAYSGMSRKEASWRKTRFIDEGQL